MVDVIRKAARALRRAPAIERRARDRRRPVERDVVLYESSFGHGMACHPEAVFRAALAAPDLVHLRHVWVLDDPQRHPDVLAEFGSHPRVRFVRRDSAAYDRVLATAGVLVNNSTFPPQFVKRPEQVYLNTWHGTPLKVMGYDEPDPGVATRNVVRNFLMCDYLLSGSPWMTQRMYVSGYRLDNVCPALVIEEGGPRTDRQWLDGAGGEVARRLAAGGVSIPEGSRVVLVAPTWHGASFARPEDDLADLESQVAELSTRLGEGYCVLAKIHHTLAAGAASRAGLRGLLVPDSLPTGSALALADVLVTDYSSIFFDYLPLGRPVVFFTPDDDRYRADRGTYLAPSELPGPVVTTVEELAAVVRQAHSGGPGDPVVTHGEAVRDAARRFAPKDDGHAAERVVDIVLRGRHDGYAVAPLPRDGRRTMLLYLGGMRSNGITTAGLGLLRHIDRSRFDVTAFYREPESDDERANVRAIPGDIRRIPRIAGQPPRMGLWVDYRRLLSQGTAMGARGMRRMDVFFEQEWRRCVGDAAFDHIVDYSGYSPFWVFLLAQGRSTTRAVWLHNDLEADRMRMHGRQRANERSLRAVFTAYRLYDRLVSVSSALRDINAGKLAEFAPPEHYVSARNTIDAERVVRGAGEHDVVLPALPPGGRRFVSVGRISPEKNHERLIRAFAAVHAESPTTRLVIVGDGPLRGKVEALVAELGLDDAVTLTGLVRNPWGVMARCDVFVLSSDYEGQPMTILEARVLGLPIVTTAFGSVRGALGDDEGLIVGCDVEPLADGMRAALRGEVPAPPFDAMAYNESALAEFARAIGA
ncbi:Teichoic acid synthase [Nostocoides japonicum T1-X7]|uniref:Teichoic acid synthase n=1 Tax=Nostocoides japonicum T1-X7 TaxID=1194083 RepID=A0A077M082_9MICO|nr:glycosyltransferase [Tetrasphaera japonica]CCH79246.1 Teichoic acid synthase [Tetrasphaera japonica T1-X7]